VNVPLTVEIKKLEATKKGGEVISRTESEVRNSRCVMEFKESMAEESKLAAYKQFGGTFLHMVNAHERQGTQSHHNSLTSVEQARDQHL